jgi:hypothetical protein
MQRFLASQKLKLGQLVTVTDTDTAQVRTIAQIFKRQHGTVYAVTLIWTEGGRVCSQMSEPWVLYKANLEQVTYTISNYGRLANMHDVLDFQETSNNAEQEKFLSTAW